MNIVCLIPTVFDFMSSIIVEGLVNLNHNVIYGSEVNKRMIDECKNSDLIFIFSGDSYFQFKRILIKEFICKKSIFIDGDDGSNLFDEEAPDYFHHCFKREFNSEINGKYPKNVYPISFAAENSYFKYSSCYIKDISVSCIMAEGTNKGRKEIVDYLNNMEIPDSYIGRVGTSNALTSSNDPRKNNYYEVLARSKMSISYYGSGNDTARFWEILANRALLLSPRLDMKVPFPMIPGVHYKDYSTVEELGELVLYYMNNEIERNEIASNGFVNLINHHTSKARAGYILDKIK